MRILFNCSVNVVGGAVQNAANFIKYATSSGQHEYLFIVSFQVKAVLNDWSIDSANIHVVESPARSKIAKLAIMRHESIFRPDVVYTMAGPTYLRFKAVHVMGISDPYITHADFRSVILNRSFFQSSVFAFKEFAKGIYARFSADYFVFQTVTSNEGFCKRFFVSSQKTYLLPNALGEKFLSNIPVNSRPLADAYRVFVPSAYYSHKNLEIILDICNILKSAGKVDMLFVTTVPSDCSFAKSISRLGLGDMIHNIGPYTYSRAQELYYEADVVFIPSVLETFSTSYLEAIALAKPLVVADKEFSREVCGRYAQYYSPLSAGSALEKILSSLSLEIDLSERDRIISRYGSQKQRFEKAISILELVINRSD